MFDLANEDKGLLAHESVFCDQFVILKRVWHGATKMCSLPRTLRRSQYVPFGKSFVGKRANAAFVTPLSDLFNSVNALFEAGRYSIFHDFKSGRFAEPRISITPDTMRSVDGKVIFAFAYRHGGGGGTNELPALTTMGAVVADTVGTRTDKAGTVGPTAGRVGVAFFAGSLFVGAWRVGVKPSAIGGSVGVSGT